MAEWSIAHAWKAWRAYLRRGPTELQMKRVASPRNQRLQQSPRDSRGFFHFRIRQLAGAVAVFRLSPRASDRSVRADGWPHRAQPDSSACTVVLSRSADVL